MVDYNIEFSHIYSDKKFGKEQEESVQILKTKTMNFLKEHKTYSTCVLIDEYNSKNDSLDISILLRELNKRNVFPNFIGLESRLILKKDFLLKNIENKKIKREYEKYINKNNRIPCSFLVAVWYLCRLGYLDLHKEIYSCYDRSDIFHGKQIINILSEKYENLEKRTIEIISNTKFANCIKNIETIFY